MASLLRYVGQATALALFAAIIGYLADSPSYVHFPADRAQVLLTFNHGAKPKGECRRLTREELARVAANMRRPVTCPRERLPVTVELTLDGRTLYHATAPPGGLSGDAPSRVYQGFAVAPGRHRLVARLRDSARPTGFDYERAADVDLAAGQRLVVDFRAETDGFVFR